MLEFFTGIISGVISGTGMGGGTILILILSIFIGINQHLAQGTNLIFFIPTSIVSIILTSKDRLINWKIGLSVAIFGVIGAILGAKISTYMDVKVLRKCFGIFLIIIVIYEVYELIKNKDKS